MHVMLADIQPGPLDEAVAGPARRGARRRRLRHRRDEARVGRTSRRRDAARVRRQCTWCATTPASGPGGQTMLWESEESDWRWCLDVNVCGMAWGIKAFVPRMIAGGDEGPHRQHVVGQRRDRADGRRRDLRDVEERGDDAHRIALLPTASTQDTKLSCSVLYPGPNWLRTRLWEAWRTRPRRVREDRSRAPPRTRASRSSSSRWKRPERRCR